MDSIKIQSGELEVEVLPAIGGRINQITSLRCDSSPGLLLDQADWERRRDTSADPLTQAPNDAGALRWGCYPMAPWPGRIACGRFGFGGKFFVIPTNLGDAAIHGTAFAGPWKLIDYSESEVHLEFILGEPWPWRGALRQSIELHDNAIALMLEIHAARGERFPAGAGWHPWFSRRGMDPRVRVSSSEYFETDETLIPTGKLLRAVGDSDLTSGPQLGHRRLDQVYALPVWPVRIDWNDLRLEFSASTDATCVCIYTPPEGFCVEPMTCAANAFNSAGIADGFDASIVDADSPLVARSRLQFWPK